MSVAEYPTPCSPHQISSHRPYRVCHVSLTLKTGGLERILADLARHYSADQFRLSFVAMREVGRFADEIRRTGCEVTSLASTRQWGQVRELAAWLKREQIDVVHTHNTYPHIYGTLAARLAGVPVIVQTRHGQRAGHGWKSRVLYRGATWLADRVVAVSDDAARLCIEVDGLPATKVQRIWNGIDLDEFDYRGPASEPVALSVARLSPEKDFPTLLQAFAKARRSLPQLRLRLVGDGPERPRLEQLAQQLNLNGAVEFLGERTDVAQLLPTGGFFVTSSKTEGISLTLLEAMAVGLPVVATNAGGNPEIVVDGVTGRITPVGDVEALANALIEMGARQRDWEAWGLAGRERVQSEFDVRRMVADYESLYVQLLKQKSRTQNR